MSGTAMIIDATKASSMTATESGFPQRRLVKMRSAFESAARFFSPVTTPSSSASIH